MATVAFTDTKIGMVKDVSEADIKSAKIIPELLTTKVSDISLNVKKITLAGYPVSKAIHATPISKPTSILPFRVSFSSIVVDGYTAKRPAPIGIAIVGVNNYIL